MHGAGLMNLGNTCFMNAVLQALFGLSDSLVLFKLSSSNSAPLTKTLLELCRQVDQTDRPVHPVAFRAEFVRQFPFFDSNDQQDAFEFTTLLLDALHQETRPSHGHSPVADAFQGTLLIKTDGACGCTSRKLEPFFGLAVPLVTAQGELIGNLADAISEFERPQPLTGVDRWQCDTCRGRVNAQTQSLISRLPDVLIVNLKRFTYTATRGLEKLTHMVEYPMTLEIPGNHLSLSAVVLHSGSATSGHYTALVADRAGHWRSYNDQHVRDTTDILSSDAYILFYKRLIA